MKDWKGAILFVEDSEIRAIPEQFGDFLRNLEATGILENLNGILFGSPGGEFSEGKEIEHHVVIPRDVLFRPVSGSFQALYYQCISSSMSNQPKFKPIIYIAY